MKNLTLILTDNCNQSCSYCFQVKGTSRMKFEVAKKAVDYFVRNSNDDPEVHFYGGEPFLEFELMKPIVEYAKRRFQEKGSMPRFTVTTNGTLLDDSRTRYCHENGVNITLSIDGVKQAHEIGRGSGSFARIEKVLSLFKRYPDILLKTVSVITPKNVKYLFESVSFLVDLGVNELQLTFQYDHEWNRGELDVLRDQYKKAYDLLMVQKTQGAKIRFNEVRPPNPLKPVFQCSAGKEGVVVTPEGLLYGCIMLIPWSKRAVELDITDHFAGLCLGHIDKINSKIFNKRLKQAYSDKRLSGQYFRHTSTAHCSTCEYLSLCSVCPASSMIYYDDPLLVPDWICEIKKIIFNISKKFWDNL